MYIYVCVYVCDNPTHNTGLYVTIFFSPWLPLEGLGGPGYNSINIQGGGRDAAVQRRAAAAPFEAVGAARRVIKLRVPRGSRDRVCVAPARGGRTGTGRGVSAPVHPWRGWAGARGGTHHLPTWLSWTARTAWHGNWTRRQCWTGGEGARRRHRRHHHRRRHHRRRYHHHRPLHHHPR